MSPPSPPPSARISPLATAALACSLLLCCPLTSLVGVVLAFAAFAQIRSSALPTSRRGALRGQRIAMAALLIGGLGLLVQAWSFGKFQNVVQREVDVSMSENVTRAFHAAERGDSAGVAATWSSAARAPSAEEVARFGEETLRRYGSFRSFSVVLRSPTGGATSGTFDVAATFGFERRELTGSARFTLGATPGALLPRARLDRIALDDADGELVLGAK